MALTTYTELKTSVGDWLNRTDLTTVIPDFIALAEAQRLLHDADGSPLTPHELMKFAEMEQMIMEMERNYDE